ncbi:MAG: DNA polymerase III subunit delta [Microscillaceae bacterium]|nr:DNA polymerase III subunit delta [Microscillaceae bacterium]
MLVSADKALQSLKKGDFAPVYFLHGEESYYIDTLTEYIEAHALSPAERGFNQILLYGAETDLGTVLAQARRFPMMAARQVVIVKEAQSLPDWRKSEAADILAHFLQNPPPTTVLVFAHKHKSLAKNTRVYKMLEKSAVVVESKKIYDYQVPDWIQQHLQAKGYRASPDALQLLAEATGPDLGKLHNELEKLLLNQPKSQPIEAETVEKNVGLSREFTVFEFQKALAARNAFKVEQIIRYWSENPKKHPLIPMLALLYNFFSRTLILYHQGRQSDTQLAQAMKVPPFALKDYRLMAQNYSLAQVVATIGHLREADLQLKGISSAGSTEANILRELSLKILSLGKR